MKEKNQCLVTGTCEVFSFDTFVSCRVANKYCKNSWNF